MPTLLVSCKTCIYDKDEDGYIHCLNCSRNYNDLYEPIRLKPNETLCIYCKRIIPDGRVFRFKDDPKRGVCFDCY